jgi:excisionase family DNA binding protein
MPSPSIDDLPDVLLPIEAARVLRIGRSACYTACSKGELPSIRIGRRVLIPKAGIALLLEKARKSL